MKPYWIAFKKGQWICDFDINGKPITTKNRYQAHRFYDFLDAVKYYNEYGFALTKEYGMNESAIEVINQPSSFWQKLKRRFSHGV